MSLNHISYGEVFGGLEGYCCSVSDDCWRNYISEHASVEYNTILQALFEDRQISNIAVLRNILIEEEYRGVGQGSDLLAQFLDEAFIDAETVILVAHPDEPERFQDLIRFYEDFSFEAVDNPNCEETEPEWQVMICHRDSF